MLSFLVIATVDIAWVFTHALISEKDLLKSIYTSVAIFIVLRIAYFKARQKK